MEHSAGSSRVRHSFRQFVGQDGGAVFDAALMKPLFSKRLDTTGRSYALPLFSFLTSKNEAGDKPLSDERKERRRAIGGEAVNNKSSSTSSAFGLPQRLHSERTDWIGHPRHCRHHQNIVLN